MTPIERTQFDAEQDTLDLKILDLLQKNRNFAFTSKEIASRLSEDQLDVEVALNRLSTPEEPLERKRVDGVFYYAIKKTITKFIEKFF